MYYQYSGRIKTFSDIQGLKTLYLPCSLLRKIIYPIKTRGESENLRVMTKEELRITLGTKASRSPDWSKLRSSGRNFFMEM